MHATVIGIDCATDPKKIGLARASWTEEGPHLTVAGPIPQIDDLVAQIINWMRVDKPVLIALDAPLGWPALLGKALSLHQAGKPLAGEPSNLFNRTTDRFVHGAIGKKPLDVGADRIARTAVSALRLLHQIRAEAGLAIPLAWQPGILEQSAAIEVYPGGTLKALGLPFTGYKRRNETERAIRRQIIDFLQALFRFDDETTERMEANGDCLDAALCCLAGLDFLSGNVLAPEDDPDLATEGWIWVRPPIL